MLFISQNQIPPPQMLLRSAYRGIERKDPGLEQDGLGYRAVSAVGGDKGRARTKHYDLQLKWSLMKSLLPCGRVWIREGNRSDVPLTQPGNGPGRTATLGMSASRPKAHFERQSGIKKHGRATYRETCTCGSGRGPRYTVLICVGPRNSSEIVMAQKQIWSGIPLFPVLVMFFISCLAETNQAPFHLPEAEAE
ncbi:NADH:ubiquinone oxidoreductase, subunit 1/F420H2 oxidoreductase subunit H [Cynara cardunculus var. scolymus]|uniref:NADH:ubiquinone oxidoreductase, subunit 1/F420H2 oxidoreductase subunit H n=1 Tax=Cynara cardunculus var. scolymus TaxID=59895 RepID=A0A103XE97_CYNCS|nr:NADH:ubiquinone oxidoreductase, subunit 1/F420H2 oxidoreductase subunit H [Cynara cardunculus var. scolymus]